MIDNQINNFFNNNMDSIALRQNFNDQLKKVEDQIKSLEFELDKAKEYKLKLIGGLETLNLLEESDENQTLIDDNIS